MVIRNSKPFDVRIMRTLRVNSTDYIDPDVDQETKVRFNHVLRTCINVHSFVSSILKKELNQIRKSFMVRAQGSVHARVM